MQLPAGPAWVREWRIEDAVELPRQANDRRIWLNLRDAFPHPYDREDAESFLALALGMQPRTFFAIECEGRIAGGIGYVLRPDVERVGAEIGYWLGVSYWGRGIATAAARVVTTHAFAVHPELMRLFAVPFATNAASARVLEKAGYRLEGTLRSSAIKNGQLLDQWLYARLRSDPG
jgi:[ribosomal protein S5]-alanine N-acetyltransferase